MDCSSEEFKALSPEEKHAYVLKQIRIERLQKDIRSLERCESPDHRIDERLQQLYAELRNLV